MSSERSRDYYYNRQALHTSQKVKHSQEYAVTKKFTVACRQTVTNSIPPEVPTSVEETSKDDFQVTEIDESNYQKPTNQIHGMCEDHSGTNPSDEN